MKKLLFILLLLPLLFAGCGSDDDSFGDRITGTWQVYGEWDINNVDIDNPQDGILKIEDRNGYYYYQFVNNISDPITNNNQYVLKGNRLCPKKGEIIYDDYAYVDIIFIKKDGYNFMEFKNYYDYEIFNKYYLLPVK